MDEANGAGQHLYYAQQTSQSFTSPTTFQPNVLQVAPLSVWSEWMLHDSKLCYYRACFISYEQATAVVANGRNSVVPDGRGGYIHYEFMGINDSITGHCSSGQTTELSTWSVVTTTTTTTTTIDPAPSSQLQQPSQGQHDGYDSVSGSAAGGGMMTSGALQPAAETHKIQEQALVPLPSRPSRRQSVVSRKKNRKMLEPDKRKQVSSNAKVNKWLDGFRPGSTFPQLPLSSLTTKPRQFSRYPKLQLSLGLPYTRQHPTNPSAAIMTSTIGIPIKLLNEAQGHIVTLEITSGQTYRGKLLDGNALPSRAPPEDNMNVQLKDITVTARDGRVSHLDQVYIRGSHVRFFIVPDMLRNAPMFRSRNVRGRGVGLARGRATVSRARAGGRGGRP
ncbi:hypothetical protein FZEAL_8419 [Fusarium zealandicum]|uniref:Sm domain-containing protein n=1 Tax=Fusarium zealandicum TaxID=1053134 RepID=A0A8H4UEK0_9HYPO|nr:hypothetical protein FZEAL_8419 [Fusarium zealandicum]